METKIFIRKLFLTLRKTLCLTAELCHWCLGFLLMFYGGVFLFCFQSGFIGISKVLGGVLQKCFMGVSGA